MSDLRRDPIIGRWVIISSERGKRPSDFPKERDHTIGQACPFCYGNEHLSPHEIAAYRINGELNKSDWWVRVVPNKFPALGVENKITRVGEGIYDKMNGFGAHEIIIETPEHNKELFEIDKKKAEDVIWMYRERICDLKKDSRFEYILIFKNRGSAAGASLYHPHSQLIVLPMIPLRVKQELSGSKMYFDYKERCIFCDIISQELLDRTRIVSENDDFVALCPYASRFPFEIWILPKKHNSHFEDIEKPKVTLLTKLLRDVLNKYDCVLSEPPYNYLIHTDPLKAGNSSHYHWHIELIPKLTRVAGFEWGTGFYINPTSPELAAQYLREA